MQDNIKLGAGGIREVEFFAQTFQLIRGGRINALQTQSLYQVLNCLVAEQIISETDQQELWAAYEFLRNTEHVLQGIGDQQTQQLPIDELAQLRVAKVMGFTQWTDFFCINLTITGIKCMVISTILSPMIRLVMILLIVSIALTVMNIIIGILI